MTSVLAHRTTTQDAFATALADALSVPDGGFTVAVKGARGIHVTEGYSVAVYPELEQQYAQTVTADEVRTFVFANAALLLTPGNVFGGWRDPSDGVAYLDVSRVVSTREEAHALAVKHNQLAYFDFAAGQSVSV